MRSRSRIRLHRAAHISKDRASTAATALPRAALRASVLRLGCCALALLAWSICAGVARAQSATSATAAEESRPEVRVGEPATLEFWNRPIVTLRANIDDLEAATRVANARERLAALTSQALHERVSVGRNQIDGLDGLQIAVATQVVFTLFPEDVDPESGESLEQIAEQAAVHLREALARRAEQRDPQILLWSALRASAAVLCGFAAIWLAIRLRALALRQLELRLTRNGLRVLGIDLAQTSVAGLRLFTRISAVLWIGASIYLGLTIALVQFPYTEPLGERLGELLIGELHALGAAALDGLPGLFTVVLILALARALSRGIGGFFQRVEEGKVHLEWLEPESAKATRRIALALLWLFAVIVAYPYVPGSQTDAFKGVSVFAGLMITLGSSGLVGQIMSGFVLVYSRALKPGDYVRVGAVEGTVTLVGVLSTKVRTNTREEVTIPNAVVIADRVTNFSRLAEPQGAVASTTVTIGYDTPWRQVHALLCRAAERTEGLRREPAPFVLQRALSDFYVEYELRAHLFAPDQRIAVLSRLHAAIQDEFNEFGVQILSPHFETQPADKVWVPRQHWHDAPAAPQPASKLEPR